MFVYIVVCNKLRMLCIQLLLQITYVVYIVVCNKLKHQSEKSFSN